MKTIILFCALFALNATGYEIISDGNEKFLGFEVDEGFLGWVFFVCYITDCINFFVNFERK